MNKAGLLFSIGLLYAALHSDMTRGAAYAHIYLLLWLCAPILLITFSLGIGQMLLIYMERKERNRWGRE